MKKRICALLAAVFALSAFVACEKEDPAVTERRSGWLLSAPAYMGGTLSYKTYNIGTGLDMDIAASAGTLQVVSQTTRTEFETYLDKVKKNDYEEVARNEVNGNLFVEYEKNGKLLYTYYVDSTKDVRVIEDNVSVAETAVEYTYTAQAGEDTVIYQYGLMNDPYGGNKEDSPYLDNGMFYIIRQANNKLILVDGGNETQATDNAASALVDFLYEITGKQKTEKLQISALVISHAHDDHKAFVHKLVEKYSDKIELESAIFNFPSWSADSQNGAKFKAFGALLKQKFPSVKYIKAHTGQSITLGDVQMDIMLTHEDLLEPKVAGSIATSNFNNTSTVVRYTINGKTFLQLGDYLSAGEILRRFTGMYKTGATSLLKSDIVQVGHHAMNEIEDLYKVVQARYALVPCVDLDFKQYGAADVPSCYQTTIEDILAANADVELYFQSRKITAVRIQKDGAIEVTQRGILGADEGYEAAFATLPAFAK